MAFFTLDGMKLGAPSYETILDTIDSASCRGVHADWLLLESLSATREECCGMAYATIWW
jgi:hypothetical protein